jgi:hypothetical protein
MAAAQAAGHPLASMETQPHLGSQPEETGIGRKQSVAVSHQWARPLVECWSLAHE